MQWNLIEKKIKSAKFSYHKDYLENADRIIKNEFVFQHVYNMEPTPELYKLTSWHKSPNDDPEWLFVLKRQEYLQDLNYAYLATQEEKYLLKSKELIFSWIENNYSSEEYRYSSWRTIDTGIRLLNWATSYSLLMKYSLLSESEQNFLKEVVNNQAQYLKDNYIEKYDLSNWGILITTGVLVFDAVNQSIINQELVDWSLKKFQLELTVQVDNEGMHWEQSPLYFVEVFRSSLCVYAAYQDNKISIPDAIEKKLKLMVKALIFQVLPNGNLLQQGDTDSVPVGDLISTANLILNGIDDGEKKDFLPLELYTPSSITKQMTLDDNNYYFDAQISGNYFINDKQNSNYLHVFNGNLGSGHGHASDGHVDLSIEGENILVDPGRFTYVNSKARRNLKSARSHNVILLDDKYPIKVKDSWKFSGVSTPLSSQTVHSDNYDAYKIVYSNPENDFYIERYVVWIKNKETVVIIDVANSPGVHTLQNNWIIGSDISINNKNDEYQLISEKGKTFKFFTEKKNEITISNQDYSPRYNEKKIVQKIEGKRNFEDIDISYSVFGKKDIVVVNNPVVRQADSSENVKPEFCKAIELQYEKDSLIISLQHLNTYIGNKLYYVNNIPVYGELSVIDESTRRLF